MYSIAFHPSYAHQVPKEHRFPMAKYELLPQQLLREGLVHNHQFFEPKKVSLNHVFEVHDKDYVNRFVSLQLSAKEGRRIGFVQEQSIVDRELLLVQGTIQGALNALDDGIAFNIAGGTHHASVSHGEGFCMLNDQAIAAQYLLNATPIDKVLIVDLDVHQGNGTADIFLNSKNVFTFSMHCENNYPFHKSKSHLDIGLNEGITDKTYLRILQNSLAKINEIFRPQFIFYQAGVDILSTDKMGKLNCSIEGCKERDRIVMQYAQKLGIPMQCSMGGGYSPQLKTILEAHSNTFAVANEWYN